MAYWQGRRVLVTGAYGFLASHLIESLLQGGAVVTGLVRDHPAESYLQLTGLDSRITLMSGDVTDLEFCRRALNEEEIQVVFHLAAQALVGLANRSPLSTFESNIRGTYILLEACRELIADRSPLEAIVVASSDKAYGDQKRLPYSEEAPLLGLHPYDASKACADILTRAFAGTYGLPAAVTRCANLYGPGDLNFSRIVPATFQALLMGQRPIIRSDGSPQRDYLLVRDAVSGYLAVAESVVAGEAAGQAFNLGTGRPVTVLELVREIIEVVGVDLEPEVLGTASSEIIHQYLDASRAQRTLGWRAATSLHDGLAVTHDWYRGYVRAHV
jgi:CDP-glucose 4,6-dehydratase